MDGLTFWQKSIIILFTSMGVLIGASIIGSLGAVLAKEPPAGTMLRLAQEIKIWAIVAAIGGTFSTIEILESGIFQGEVRGVVKQLFYVISGLAGAQLGYFIINSIVGGNQ